MNAQQLCCNCPVHRQALFLINNKISKIHPKALKNMDHLRLLYLSYNLLTEIPANLPRNILELRFHGNRINSIQKDAFKGLRSLHVLGKRLDTTQRYNTPTTAPTELLAVC